MRSTHPEDILYIADTHRTGRGLYSRCGFKSGEPVFTMQGEKRHYISRTVEDAFRFENWLVIDKDLFLDPASPYLFANHSCEPNLGIRDALDFIALRDIAPHEQLTYDYSLTTDELPWMMKCNCRRRSCRGIIRSVQHLPEGIYRRYLPYVGRYVQDVYAATEAAGRPVADAIAAKA
ncbi:MAG TPA: SET domain-containing protein-lysine N-methyltransferase [Rhizomicrobium sp.]|nr:SET domain-containing protein-lysine N-methyltransferase [Rhizomicrobium sp.]